jgi:hypothetical protein
MPQQPDEWLVTDGCGEYVRYFNHTGTVMHFTPNREEAWRTADSRDAFEVARIAREVYQRRFMRMGLA